MQRFLSVFSRLEVSGSFSQYCAKTINRSTVRKFSNSVTYNNGSISIPKKKHFTINDLLGHIKNGKLFYLKQLTNVFDTIDFAKLKTDEAVLLLKCCGSSVVDSSQQQRNIVCQELFKGLHNINNVNRDIFNRYIKTCTENRFAVPDKDLLLKCEPNNDTYKLLLENACQLGNIKEAFYILELMKVEQIPLSSDNINSLILAHAIDGGLKSAEDIINTVRSAQISEDNTAKLMLLKGLIRRKNLQEFKKAVNIYTTVFSEHQFLDLLEELGLNGVDSWLSEIKQFYKHLEITREFQKKVEMLCIHLVHMKQPMSAINIYEQFVEPTPDILYGVRLLKEMLHCDIDIKTIISIARSLIEKETNIYILENLTEMALKFKYVDQAWELLKNLNCVRPHYFWPILINYGRTHGENGVFSVLKHVQEFNVKLDNETLEQYVIPNCELSNIKILMLKLQEVGFSVRDIVSPLLVVLLRQKKTKRAADLCQQYNVDIFGEDFVQLLAKTWMLINDSSSILTILAKYCESNRLDKDPVGTFLINIAMKYESRDLMVLVNLIKLTKKHRLNISSNSADNVQEICRSIFKDDSLKDFELNLQSLVNFGLNISEDPLLKHPKSMTLEELECHLIELQEKKMETRGVLRRLIQMHATKGNINRAKDLRKLFLGCGYEESAGIKSSIMHSYISGGHLDEAMDLYNELKTFHPDFSLDNFKFIDLVTLLISRNRFDEGYSIFEAEISTCKRMGNPQTIERNCRELLNSCKNADQLDKIFTLLSRSGLARISNVLLGPMVRIHLKSGEINKAVERYIQLSKQFNCTPVQLEILKEVSMRHDEANLDKVLRATEAVHGSNAAQVGLIAALAENGQINPLTKYLMNTEMSIRPLLRKRCERWVEERKIEPLKHLLAACNRLSHEVLQMDFILSCIFDIYELIGDYDGALEYFNELPEDNRNLKVEQTLQVIRDKIKYNRNIANRI